MAGIIIGIIGVVLSPALYLLGRRDGKRAAQQTIQMLEGIAVDLKKVITALPERMNADAKRNLPASVYNAPDTQTILGEASATAGSVIYTIGQQLGGVLLRKKHSGLSFDDIEPAEMTHGASYVGSGIIKAGYPVGAHSSTDAKPDGRIILVNPDAEGPCFCGSGKKHKECHGKKEGP